jgi:hypothetical protein
MSGSPLSSAAMVASSKAFQLRLNSHMKRSPPSTPIKGLVIANQNGKSSLSRARILMLMRFLLSR